ncbi:MAG: hypothetical protein ACLPKB_30365 [Xanthobacteraceae bacterium]
MLAMLSRRWQGPALNDLLTMLTYTASDDTNWSNPMSVSGISSTPVNSTQALSSLKGAGGHHHGASGAGSSSTSAATSSSKPSSPTRLVDLTA